MKKLLLTKIALGLTIAAIAQQAPTGNSHPNPNYNDWFRGGNNGNPGTSNNIFGTMWNSPIYTYTAGVNRSVL